MHQTRAAPCAYSFGSPEMFGCGHYCRAAGLRHHLRGYSLGSGYFDLVSNGRNCRWEVAGFARSSQCRFLAVCLQNCWANLAHLCMMTFEMSGSSQGSRYFVSYQQHSFKIQRTAAQSLVNPLPYSSHFCHSQTLPHWPSQIYYSYYPTWFGQCKWMPSVELCQDLSAQVPISHLDNCDFF